MSVQAGKMSRRKQAKPNRLNEDEENDSGVFNGKLLLLLPFLPSILLLLCGYHWRLTILKEIDQTEIRDDILSSSRHLSSSWSQSRDMNV